MSLILECQPRIIEADQRINQVSDYPSKGRIEAKY